MTAISRLLSAVVLTVTLTVGCSKSQTDKPSVSADFSISQLNMSGGQQSALRPGANAALVAALAANPAPNSAWATVDGIRLKIMDVVMNGPDSSATVADFNGEGGRVLEIGGERYTGKLQANGAIPYGTYTDISIHMRSSFDLKAYGYTAANTCYTTVIQVKCLAGKIAPTSLPGYDYFHYDFLYVTTAHGAHDGNSTSGEGSMRFSEPLVIDQDHPAPKIQLLIDTYRLTTLWDGTGARPSVAPFHWSNNDGLPTSTFFPDGQPNFGLSYLPTYLSSNDTGDTVGEVYVAAADEAAITSFDTQSYNLAGIQYLTLALKSDGTLVGSRVVGFDTSELAQFSSGFPTMPSGSFQFFNGEWNSATRQPYQDRLVTGFHRSAVGDTFSATLANGPDCGGNVLDPGHPEWGNRLRPCLNADKPLYFKRAR